MHNASYHPLGRAIDVNQVGRGVRAGGRTLPLDVEDALAAKWGLRSGNSFSRNDNGHFEVYRAEMARDAIDKLGRIVTKAQDQAARPTPATAPKSLDYLHGPGGFDVNTLTSPSAPLGVNSSPVTNNDNSRAVTIDARQTNHVSVQGSNDPQAHGRVMEGALDRAHQTLLENTQSALRA